MVQRYEGIFRTYYPAYNSTGFTERNLTNNIIIGLEKSLGNRTFSWFELPTGDTKSGHIDAIAWNQELDFFACIEAKRFSNPKPKIASLLTDLRRIAKEETYLAVKISHSIQKYVILLADVWTETKEKKGVFQNWGGSFLRDHWKSPLEGEFPQSIQKGSENYFKHRFESLGNIEKAYKNYCVLMYAAKLNFPPA